MIRRMTGDIGLRLLKLQQEFASREEMAGHAERFGQPDWRPRSEQEIASDYETALRELLA